MRFVPGHPWTPDLSGRRYGRLTVIGFAGIEDKGPRRKASLWHCECSCGNSTVVTASRLNYGWTTSCGCWQREAPEQSQKNLRHGHAALPHSPEYRIWNRIKQYCRNPNSHHYEWYGARGIAVCDRWNDFETFLADVVAEIGRKPKWADMIDRIDNDGDYEPGNIRWVT